MKKITIPTRGEVCTGSQVSLDLLKSRMGKMPNLYATMGYSEYALKTFLDFGATLSKGMFSAKEREAISLLFLN